MHMAIQWVSQMLVETGFPNLQLELAAGFCKLLETTCLQNQMQEDEQRQGPQELLCCTAC